VPAHTAFQLMALTQRYGMTRPILLLLTSSSVAHGAMLSSHSPRVTAGGAFSDLRGGALSDFEIDTSDFDIDVDAGGTASEFGDSADKMDDTPLTEEQVMAKLNEIPTFVLMGKGGGFVALQIKDGGRTIPFFLEPEEAKAVLNVTQSAHPEEAIKLVSVGLGNALKLCVETEKDESAKEAISKFDGHFRLQGSSRMASEVAPKLKEMMTIAGIEPGVWQLPVFLCEELARGEIVPVFFNPREIRSAWKLNELPEDQFPEKFVMMDLRMMVADMQKPGTGMPWSKVAFIGATGAAEFANELLGLQSAAEPE